MAIKVTPKIPKDVRPKQPTAGDANELDTFLFQGRLYVKSAQSFYDLVTQVEESEIEGDTIITPVDVTITWSYKKGKK